METHFVISVVPSVVLPEPGVLVNCPFVTFIAATELLWGGPRPKSSDQRAVILPTDSAILLQFQNPIIDGPGADIIIAGWVGPPPSVDVFNSKNRRITLNNPSQLMDTWNRNIFGYDINKLPGDFFTDSVLISGTHRRGPHQGFELNEIRARVQ